MVSRRRTSFDALLTQVLEDGSDARFVEARELRPPQSSTAQDQDMLDSMAFDRGGDESAGPSTPRCGYSRLDVQYEDAADLASERQLQLSPGGISWTLCASVLAYDVLGFVVCFQWGMIALRVYSVLFGRIAAVHDALYALSCIFYAMSVVTFLSWFVCAFFPSSEELSHRVPACARATSDVGRSPMIDGALQ